MSYSTIYVPSLVASWNSVIFPLNKIAKIVICDKSLKPPLFGGECSFFKNQTAVTSDTIMIRRLERQFIKTSLESMKLKSINRIAKIVYSYLCLKHWLSAWWYQAVLIPDAEHMSTVEL
jgi:hypothetical protein